MLSGPMFWMFLILLLLPFEARFGRGMAYQECTAVVKVVTAQELAHEAMSTSNTTAHNNLIDVDEAEERQHKQRYAQIEDEQELKL
jgi:competence protein ComGC